MMNVRRSVRHTLAFLTMMAAIVLIALVATADTRNVPSQTEHLGIIEIRIKVDGQYKPRGTPAWEFRQLRRGPEWSLRSDLYNPAAHSFVVLRIDDDFETHRIDVIPLYAEKSSGPTNIAAVAAADLSPLSVQRNGDLLYISGGARDLSNTRTLLPGDTLTSDQWPGVTVIFHPLMNKDELLLFTISADSDPAL